MNRRGFLSSVTAALVAGTTRAYMPELAKPSVPVPILREAAPQDLLDFVAVQQFIRENEKHPIEFASVCFGPSGPTVSFMAKGSFRWTPPVGCTTRDHLSLCQNDTVSITLRPSLTRV